MDCMLAMKDMPNNYYDLAIVDPPYGLNKGSIRGGLLNGRKLIQKTDKMEAWDQAPNQEYFWELMRVSKNQIIWGGNYFQLMPTRCVIVWDKQQPWENFSQVEIAWTSFYKPAAIFRFGITKYKKEHPTQKPVELYNFLLSRYAKPGDKVIDTHLGSGSICLAAHNYKVNLDGFEIDPEYYEIAIRRLNKHQQQQQLF